MQLSKNDLKLIKYLFECEFLTREQIKKYVLSNINNSYIQRRLPMLKKNDYIKYKDNPFSIVNEKYIYMVDYFAEDSLMMKEIHNDFENMCDEFDLNYIDPDDYRLKDKLDNRKIFKQYKLNNVRFMLEDIGAKNWIPYYIFKNLSMKNKMKGNYNKSFDVYPDGVIYKNKLIGIELERKIKPRIHYKNTFKKYAKEELFDTVIFITYGKNSGNMYNSLQNKLTPKFAQEYNDLPNYFFNKFYVIKYEDIINGKYDIYNKEMDKTINIKNII